jgi:hypothetical protein
MKVKDKEESSEGATSGSIWNVKTTGSFGTLFGRIDFCEA